MKQEKHRFHIYLKGEIPTYLFRQLDYTGTMDFKYEYGGISVYCTEEEVQKIMSNMIKDDHLKVIGYENLSDTLVEIKEALNDDGTISDKMLITDLYDKHKGYYLSRPEVESMLESDSDRNRLYTENYGYPRRFYVKKCQLEKLTNR